MLLSQSGLFLNYFLHQTSYIVLVGGQPSDLEKTQYARCKYFKMPPNSPGAHLTKIDVGNVATFVVPNGKQLWPHSPISILARCASGLDSTFYYMDPGI